ncbi:Hormone-sensitive lipase [Liparis tanakae]|uniref:Hormone-sensitive lipase n=1 Tax=Liparis tanakae TaxID=230148 RepID=A0A4Z2JHI8_9TELE|nr:Hormone-sensitive lipase [Liparis tanakae]
MLSLLSWKSGGSFTPCVDRPALVSPLSLRGPVARYVMDTKAVFAALYGVCEENATFFSGGAKGTQGDAARRLVDTMKLIQEHGRSLEPVVSGFAAVYHHFDFDPHIPANGYRSLVKVSAGMFVCFHFTPLQR